MRNNRTTAPPPRPTTEDIAQSLVAPDEYGWAVQYRLAWGVGLFLLSMAVLGALGAVGYIGGRQAYVFSGLGVSRTPAITAYLKTHSAAGITLAQSAPAVAKDWPVKLAQGVWECWERPQCQTSLVQQIWPSWRSYAGYWFPQLAQAVLALQVSAGAFLMMLLMYLYAKSDVGGWKRWEQRQELAARKAQRRRQSRGG